MESPPPRATPAAPIPAPAPDPPVAKVVGLPPVVDYGVVRRSRARLWGRIALAAVVLAVLVVAGRRYYGELHRLRSANPWVIAAIALLYVAARIPPADLMRAALRSLGHRVGRVETFFVLMVQYYVNMLVPRAGIGAPAGYMKLRHGVPISDLGAAQLLPLTLVQFACLGVAALACQAALAAAGAAGWDPLLAAVFAAVAVLSVIPILVPLPGSNEAPTPEIAGDGNGEGKDNGNGNVRRAGGMIRRFLARLSYACRRLGRDRVLLARAAAAHGVVLLLRTARVQLSFEAVGHPVGFWQAFVASAAADVMFLVSVTPGALGFREGGMIYAARVLDTTGDAALAAALLDRLVVTGCNVVLGQVGIWRYVGRATARQAPLPTAAAG